jgi:GntR family transcriptional repressor for pyruvate dehydrogenase complex
MAHDAATLMVAVGDISLDAMATARLELEAVCCRLAAANRTGEHLDTMRQELKSQRE